MQTCAHFAPNVYIILCENRLDKKIQTNVTFDPSMVEDYGNTPMFTIAEQTFAAKTGGERAISIFLPHSGRAKPASHLHD